MAKQIRVLVFGAHPDDCEFMAGGLAALYVKHGHVVKFVSLTNGDTGHFAMGGGALARRREAEAKAAGKVLGIEYEVIDLHNGELTPAVENRKVVIRLIRLFKPDLVLTHSPDDYHPDHRYTSTLVQDSAYIVTVPMNLPLTPHLLYNPYYGYIFGSPTRSPSFRPEIFIPCDEVIEKKLRMIFCHESQVLEWMPYNQNALEWVPKGKPRQRKWLDKMYRVRLARFADHYRDLLVAQYGEKIGKKVRYAEGIQVSPFGASMDAKAVARLFPFLPKGTVTLPEAVSRRRWTMPRK